MACMHIQTKLTTGGSACKPVYRLRRQSLRLSTVSAATAPVQGAHNTDSEVARILGQHRLLIEHGFSYDQASLILQICENRSSSQTAVNTTLPTDSAVAADPPQQLEAHTSSPSAASTDNRSQQQTGLRSLEDRLSFVETELLKHSLTIDATGHIPGIGDDVTDSSSVRSHPLPTTVNAGDTGYEGHSGLPQLDPQVLAIAEALLIRQGRVLPSTSTLHNPATAHARLYHQQQQQGQMRDLGGSTAATDVPPSSIWSRRVPRTQLRAKPWRYQDIRSAGSNPGKQLLPYGYMPDADMVAGDPHMGGQDELVPYEPNGWAVAGTVMLVYVGVLLTFFAVIAGTGDTSGVDPDLMMMLWS